MNVNLQLGSSLEDIKLNKHIAKKITEFENSLQIIENDIREYVTDIINESDELNESIEKCPSFIEFSARYSFNDTDELRSIIREFFQKNLKNKQVLIENTLDNILSISVPMVECLNEESIANNIDHALYFVGEESSIDDSYNVRLSEDSYKTIVGNLHDLINVIEALEEDEFKVLENLKESPEKAIDFYKYCEISRALCKNLK